MTRFKLLAASTFLCGIISLIAAAESFAEAQTCTPFEVSPAVCKPAHSTGPIENSSGSYCYLYSGYFCLNLTDCSAQYGIAYPGDCELSGLGGSGGTSICTEDDHTTVVSIKYYDAFCIFSGSCDCYWTASNQEPPVNTTLCDCTD